MSIHRAPPATRSIRAETAGSSGAALGPNQRGKAGCTAASIARRARCRLTPFRGGCDTSHAMAAREYTVRPYNQRMANSVARRAHLADEGGVAVAFTFNNLATMLVLGAIEDVASYIPVFGGIADLAISIFGFYFRRIVLVTGQNVYVFRDLPFHYPGKVLLKKERG